MDAWLDKEKLFPGFNWEREIRKAVRETDVVLICLSKQFNQAGHRQKEVRLALDTAMEQPEGEIFIISIRLEECETLESLEKLHWADIFEEDGYQRLVNALRMRADKIGATLQANKEWTPTKNATPNSRRNKSVEPKQEKLISKQIIKRNKDKSGARRLYFYIVHVLIFFFGLIVGGWMGILFISLPLFLVCYYVLYKLAFVLLPVSNPEDRAERWKRFVILASYTWGIQFPLIVVDGQLGKRLNHVFQAISPGIILCRVWY